MGFRSITGHAGRRRWVLGLAWAGLTACAADPDAETPGVDAGGLADAAPQGAARAVDAEEIADGVRVVDAAPVADAEPVPDAAPFPDAAPVPDAASVPGVPTMLQAPVEVRVERQQLVLVLDASGSMLAPLEGEPRWDRLRVAFDPLLHRAGPIDLGAVVFSSSVRGTVPIAADAGVQIADLLAATMPEGGTDYAAPLSAALGLVQAAPTVQPLVLFVTDGEPNPGAGDGIAEANALWDAGAVILAADISRSSFGALIAVAGTPESRGDRDFYFTVDSADRLAEFAAQVEAALLDLACRITLAEPAPEGVGFVLVEGEVETPLALVPNGDQSLQPGPAAALVDAGPPARYLINWAACRPVQEAGAHIVMRWPAPGP